MCVYMSIWNILEICVGMLDLLWLFVYIHGAVRYFEYTSSVHTNSRLQKTQVLRDERQLSVLTLLTFEMDSERNRQTPTK